MNAQFGKGVMGRKGQSFEMVDWLPKLAVLLGIIVAVLFFTQYYTAVSVDTVALRQEIFLQRLFDSPTGLTYIDSAGTPWPGTIDMRKFSQEQLEASIVPQERDWIAAELSIGGNSITYGKYADWQRMIAAGTGVSTMRELPVLTYDGNSIERNTVRVTLITPRD